MWGRQRGPGTCTQGTGPRLSRECRGGGRGEVSAAIPQARLCPWAPWEVAVPPSSRTGRGCCVLIHRVRHGSECSLQVWQEARATE